MWNFDLEALLERHGVNGHGWCMERNDLYSYSPMGDAGRFTFGSAPEMQKRIDTAVELRDTRHTVYEAERALLAAAREAVDAQTLDAGQVLREADAKLALLLGSNSDG